MIPLKLRHEPIRCSNCFKYTLEILDIFPSGSMKSVWAVCKCTNCGHEERKFFKVEKDKEIGWF